MSLELLLHFLKFNIRTDSLAIKDWIDRLYVSNDLTTELPSRSSALRLHIENKDASTRLMLRLPEQAVFAETNLCNGRCYYRDGIFFSANHGEYWHEMEYDMAENSIRVNVGGKFLLTGQFLISNLIRPILQSFILPFYGIKTLHGAVLNKGEKTIFIAGSGGMGKSTTALQLLRGGYEILSDDGPFFIVEGSRVYALSSLDYVHLTESTLRLFPEVAERRIGQKDNREKFCVRIADLSRSGAFRRPLRLTHYIRLHRDNGLSAPRLIKIPRSAVHRDLIDEHMVIFRRPALRDPRDPFRAYSAFTFDLLGKVVREVETLDLEFADRHLLDVPALLDRL